LSLLFLCLYPDGYELPRLNTGSRRQTGFPGAQAKLNCYPQSSIPVGLHDYCCKKLCVFYCENVDTVFCALPQLSIIYKKQKQHGKTNLNLSIHHRLIQLVRRGPLRFLNRNYDHEKGEKDGNKRKKSGNGCFQLTA
jgi:hypothetical protein